MKRGEQSTGVFFGFNWFLGRMRKNMDAASGGNKKAVGKEKTEQIKMLGSGKRKTHGAAHVSIRPPIPALHHRRPRLAPSIPAP